MQNSPSTKQGGSRNRVPTWLYDPKEKAICGRTAQSWLFICIYYLCFYFLLVCFSSGLLLAYIYTQVTTREGPVRIEAESALRFSPGLRFRPMETHASIKYSKGKEPSYREYVKMLNDFLGNYSEQGSKFSVRELGNCSKDKAKDYGYDAGTPCILLTINKIYRWRPDPKHIEVLGENPLVECYPKATKDTEKRVKFAYYPGIRKNETDYGQFDNKYFPFLGQDDYLSPIVAVQLKILAFPTKFSVNCKLVNVKNAYDRPLEFRVDISD